MAALYCEVTIGYPKVSGPVTPWAPFTVPLGERVVVPDYSAAGAAQSLRESMERMGLAQPRTSKPF